MAEATTTAPATSPNGETEPKPKGYEGQTFLVGEEIYVRGIEEEDAKAVTAWHDTIFPTSTSRAATIIKEDLPKQWSARKNTMLLVRKADDRVVGSVVIISSWPPGTDLSIYVDPMLGAAGARLKAEAITMIVPWIAEENQKPVIWIELASDEALAIAAAERIGMRETARFREALWRRGQRRDIVAFEYLNPTWMATLGDPNAIELERSGTGQPRPVTPSVTLDVDPPSHAVMVGKRVYLRALQKEDAEPIARWSRRETEPFWDAGRFVRSPVLFAHWTQEEQKEDPPEHIWWAVCLRENDELIGQVGLIDLDLVNRYAETGSEINRPDYRGGGYGSEAKHLLLEYSFERLNLHMVRSFVIFPNTRSAAALRKQGYREAGRFNWAFNLNGTYGAVVVFDLLAEEWRALPRG
ncbi:MAG: GNAT family N-acetyltransferase [Chloroflexia bacterium]|nr:GNAT family N-acetyltransferase [Chloroflexia bacterium]